MIMRKIPKFNKEYDIADLFLVGMGTVFTVIVIYWLIKIINAKLGGG